MFRAIKNETDLTVEPMWFFPEGSGDANNFYLVHMDTLFSREVQYTDQYLIVINLVEAVKSNV